MLLPLRLKKLLLSKKKPLNKQNKTVPIVSGRFFVAEMFFQPAITTSPTISSRALFRSESYITHFSLS